MEVGVEAVDNRYPAYLAVGNVVKLLLDVGCKVIVEDIGEVLGEEVIYVS